MTEAPDEKIAEQTIVAGNISATEHNCYHATNSDAPVSWHSVMREAEVASHGSPTTTVSASIGHAVSTPAHATLSRADETVQAIKRLGMADNVYDGRSPVPQGWTRLTDKQIRQIVHMPAIRFHPQNMGLRAALYRSTDGRYVLAFKGTTTAEDGVQDAKQGYGMPSEYYQAAIALAAQVSAHVHGRLETTGHSLGGGLAAAAALANNLKATTFVAAGVQPQTLAAVHFPDGRPALVHDRDLMPDGQHRVDNYELPGQILATLQHPSPAVLATERGVGRVFHAPANNPAAPAGVQHMLYDRHAASHMPPPPPHMPLLQRGEREIQQRSEEEPTVHGLHEHENRAWVHDGLELLLVQDKAHNR